MAKVAPGAGEDSGGGDAGVGGGYSGAAGGYAKDEADAKLQSGEGFKQGGELDLSTGPVKKRRCTNPEWCVLFAAHIVFFWFCAFQGAADGDPMKLVNPRDYKGQYCAIEKQWNKGTNLKSFEKALYTLNLTSTVDPIAEKFICSTNMQSTLINAGIVSQADYTAACGSSLSIGDLAALTSELTNSLAGFFSDPTAMLTGSGGGTSILGSLTKNFHLVCTTTCSQTSAAATDTVTYSPAPTAQYYNVWTSMVSHCSGAGASQPYCVLDKFRFNALPPSLCPYTDKQKCVVIPGIKFEELTSGYCTIKIDSGIASAVGSQMSTYLDGLAKTNLMSGITGGFDSALGDIQNTWDVFILVSVLSLVCGFVYLVLLRFLVKPVVWLSILLVFAFFLVGGLVSILYSGMCKDSDFESSAKSQATSVTNTTAAECGGQYKIQDETQRDVLMYVGYILLAFAAAYLLLICCLFSRIRLAIAINEVAAMFVYNTPHIVFVPIVQAVIGILWCAAWMALASFLLSQVPDDFVPTGSFASYAEAMGTEDTPGKCNDAWPSGFGWQDVTSSDCITNKKCWKCAPPRYIFDYRFAFSFFSFLWHNAFFVACGQCIIAGAVGIWFFRSKSEDKDLDMRSASRKGVGTAVYNALVYHCGSLAFGSFILAVVQFLKYLMYYISKQAKAQKNKVLEILAKIAGYCLWCFEKCVKFLNKNAYIQIALMSTPFCTSAKNAFWLILRNAVRFALLGSLGGVIRFIGKGFVMATTALLGFLLLDAMHGDDIDTPVVLVILYLIIGYFVGALFMNVFGLAVDSTLQCFIATEEMGIGKDFIPEKLQKFVDDTADSSKSLKSEFCCML